ncbi:MAG: FHA domain-containing protein [Magnetococcales bacterium]|nr:FHA domain-containing protein [Magnetococcales bacterium]
MKTYWIGRQTNNMDVTISHDSISSLHAELVETDDGRYYLTDCASTNGTFQRKSGQWVRIRQTYVGLTEPILLGAYETTVRDLLSRRRETGPIQKKQQGGSSRYMRNPDTGEPERIGNG